MKVLIVNASGDVSGDGKGIATSLLVAKRVATPRNAFWIMGKGVQRIVKGGVK